MILRYNDNFIKSAIKADVKPEPWLHVIIEHAGTTKAGNVTRKFGHYCIYVWDTRKVLETGQFEYQGTLSSKFMTSDKARDNRQPLVGVTGYFSHYFEQKETSTDQLRRHMDAAVREQNKIRRGFKR